MNILNELMRAGVLTLDQMQIVKQIANEQNQMQQNQAQQNQMHLETIKQLGFISSSILDEFICKKYNLSKVDLSKSNLDVSVAKKLDKSYCEQHCLLPFNRTKNAILIAISSEPELQVKDVLKRVYSLNLEFFLEQEHSIKEMIDRVFDEINNDCKQDSNKWANLIETAQQTESFGREMIYKLIEHAVIEKASDIHLEPQEQFVRIRLRKDGLLNPLCVFSKKQWPGLCTCLKLLSNMNISQSLLPQDGRFDCYVFGRKVDLRVSTRPVSFGENIVIRILDIAHVKLNFQELGYKQKEITQFYKIMQNTSGIFIVTGPTGSGKSTLLSTMLEELDQMHKGKVSIATIEDPIERINSNFRQTDISIYKQMTFASAFKSILRQDPDIISVSEIRDEETASLALRAAMAGRMVLTTLHTNDIFGIFDRLEDLKINKHMLIHYLCGIATQRLVRKICDECYGAGCQGCNYTQFKGRIAIAQVMLMDDATKELFLNKSVQQAKQELYAKGMQSFREQLLQAVDDKNTTYQEANRVFNLNN